MIVKRLLICALAATLGLAATPAGAEALIVNQVDGRDDVWSDAQVRNLTYCVSTRFGGNHSHVATAVVSGANMWESRSIVDYVHVSSEDDECTARNRRVVFSVQPTSNSGVYIRGFFPSTPRRHRILLVNASNTFNGDFRAADIMGHELGHTLGFRHEHTRPESGTCFEDNRWRALTAYDANSIMHYPWCNGGERALSFSSSDGAGVASIYN